MRRNRRTSLSGTRRRGGAAPARARHNVARLPEADRRRRPARREGAAVARVAGHRLAGLSLSTRVQIWSQSFEQLEGMRPGLSRISADGGGGHGRFYQRHSAAARQASPFADAHPRIERDPRPRHAHDRAVGEQDAARLRRLRALPAPRPLRRHRNAGAPWPMERIDPRGRGGKSLG